jgi:hypothetical protein
MSTTVCEYPSLVLDGERLRVERTGRGCYELCRIDKRGRRIRAMTMQISRTTAAAHLLTARSRKGSVIGDVSGLVPPARRPASAYQTRKDTPS